jgi:hypothetical protein
MAGACKGIARHYPTSENYLVQVVLVEADLQRSSVSSSPKVGY